MWIIKKNFLNLFDCEKNNVLLFQVALRLPILSHVTSRQLHFAEQLATLWKPRPHFPMFQQHHSKHDEQLVMNSRSFFVTSKPSPTVRWPLCSPRRYSRRTNFYRLNHTPQLEEENSKKIITSLGVARVLTWVVRQGFRWKPQHWEFCAWFGFPPLFLAPQDEKDPHKWLDLADGEVWEIWQNKNERNWLLSIFLDCGFPNKLGCFWWRILPLALWLGSIQSEITPLRSRRVTVCGSSDLEIEININANQHPISRWIEAADSQFFFSA